MLMLRVIGAGGIALVTHVLYLSMDFIYGASVCQKSEEGKYVCLVCFTFSGFFSYMYTCTF